MNDEPVIHARLDPSPVKRWTSVLIMAGLGLALIYLVAANPLPSFGATLLVIGLGVAALFVARFLYRSTRFAMLLTDAGLVLEDGTVVAELDNIEAVDRGIMAFKPSNGFAVRLREPRPRGWAPGVWWRTGRRVGVGGATSRDQARNMADQLNAMLGNIAPPV